MVERLADHLGTWAGADPQRMAVAETVRIITDTCRDISVLVADGSLGQDLGAGVKARPRRRATNSRTAC